MVLTYMKMLRVHQWLKSAFIFIPSFFGARLFVPTEMSRLLLGFLAFSFIASAIYIINDLKDLESDRIHPVKSKRPIAAGAVKPRAALATMAALLVAGFGIALRLDLRFASILAVYCVLNVGYCFGLKKIAIVDIVIIALGFFLRVVAGGAVGNIHISKWLILMTFLLALFLGLAKRRDDVLIFMASGRRMREALHGYNLEFINAAMVLMGSVILVSYIMYTVSEEVAVRLGENVYLSTFFVLVGLLRYLQIALVYRNTGSPTKVLLKDRFLQLALVGWVGFFFAILYTGAR